MYIDLVLCKHDKCSDTFLFQAPAWSYLQENDKVLVNTRFGEQNALVVSSVTVNVDSEFFKFAVKACKAKLPLKTVIGKIKIEKYEYETETKE